LNTDRAERGLAAVNTHAPLTCPAPASHPGRHEIFVHDRCVYINKYAPDGAQLWDRGHGGVNELMDRPLAVAVDAAGFVHVLVQATLTLDEGPDFSFADARLVVLRITPDGTLVWRWEHTTLPFETGESYVPIGDIGVVGDRLVVLEHNHDRPTLRLELDAAGRSGRRSGSGRA